MQEGNGLRGLSRQNTCGVSSCEHDGTRRWTPLSGISLLSRLDYRYPVDNSVSRKVIEKEAINDTHESSGGSRALAADPRGVGRGLGNCQKPLKESEYFLPPVLRRFGSVVRTIPGEERVSCLIIAMKLVVLAEPLKRAFSAIYVFGRRIGIFVTEQAHERT